MDEKIISRFDGDYRFLSNFHMKPVTYEGVTYPSVEHAYQASKMPPEMKEERVRFAETVTPGQAKRQGRKLPLREDWERIKVDVMINLLREKFKDGEEKQKLLETNDAVLIEGNNWGDTYWGISRGIGKNVLGRLLMRVRRELQEGLI